MSVEDIMRRNRERKGIVPRPIVGSRPSVNQADSLRTRRRHNQPVRYAYGITTVPERRDTHFPVTLQSLRDAGFDAPRLFVDGDTDAESWRRQYNLEVSTRYPTIRTFGNWILALGELYIRDAWADRYAIFQDDFITYKNLREYLDSHEMPDKGYWNLYTMPRNQVHAPKENGWFLSNQRGLGAVALVFSREAVTSLLCSQHMVDRPKDMLRGWRAVDGGIVTAMNKAGYKEYVHSPSLVQHIGKKSSMQNREQPLATYFLGEKYNAKQLIQGTAEEESNNETTTKSVTDR